MSRRAVVLVCDRSHAPSNVALLVRHDGAGWVPVRAKNMTGKNPLFRGLSIRDNWHSESVAKTTNAAFSRDFQGYVVGTLDGGGTRLVYRFECPRCAYTLSVACDRLDVVLDDTPGVARVHLHEVAAKL